MMTSREELGYRLESMFDEYIEKIQNNQSSRKPRFSAIINSYRTPKKFQRDLEGDFCQRPGTKSIVQLKDLIRNVPKVGLLCLVLN